MKTLIALTLATVALLGSCATTATAQLTRLAIDVTRAEDVRAIKKLQRAYGYYADRGLWDDLANLFTDDAFADYPSGIFDGNASIRAMFIQNLGQGKPGLAEGRIYNHTILQPVVDLAPDGATATGRWRVLGMLGSFGRSAIWADSLYRFDYVKQNGRWKIKSLIAYAGSGGSYDEGWVPPKPRPPGYVDTSPVRFNLAHPADRPRNQPCEDDASVCVVPFPYPNRGGIVSPAQVSAMNVSPDGLIQRAQRLADEQAVMNLQHAYGYYLDRGLWSQVADLFAPDGTREVGQAGVYVGRKQILRSLALAAPKGLRPGELNDHLEFEPVVDVAPDGRSAKARIFELAFVGGAGQPARLVQNVHENEYVQRASHWMIQSMHVYTILVTDYDQGWAKSALPAPAPSTALAPDRLPTVAYEAYPKVYTPPLHFDLAAARVPSGKPVSSVAVAEQQVQRAMDYDEVENLQNAYGYYAEKSQWSDIAALFTDHGIGHQPQRHSQVPEGFRSRGTCEGRAEQPASASARHPRCRRWPNRKDSVTGAATDTRFTGPRHVGRRSLRERAREGERHVEVQAPSSLPNLQVSLQGRMDDARRRRGAAPAVAVHPAVPLPQSARLRFVPIGTDDEAARSSASSAQMKRSRAECGYCSRAR
jgi:hypothetical protein